MSPRREPTGTILKKSKPLVVKIPAKRSVMNLPAPLKLQAAVELLKIITFKTKIRVSLLTKRIGLLENGCWQTRAEAIGSYHSDCVVGEWLEVLQCVCSGSISYKSDGSFRHTCIVARGRIGHSNCIRAASTTKPQHPQDGDCGTSHSNRLQLNWTRCSCL